MARQFRVRAISRRNRSKVVLLSYCGPYEECRPLFNILQTAHLAGKPTLIELCRFEANGRLDTVEEYTR